MSEMTSVAAPADERARTLAFIALILGAVAIEGGGSFSTQLQMWTMTRFMSSDPGLSYALSVGALPLTLSGVALWTAHIAVHSGDSLARSVCRAARILAYIAIVGTALAMVTASSTMSMN